MIIALIREWLKKTSVHKAAVAYALIICAVYAPVVFYGRTASAAARYPWFAYFPPEHERMMTKEYPNTFNVDIASPAAYEEPIDLFVGNQLRRGTYPLWNPFIACGSLLQESFSTRVLFPYQLLQDIAPWCLRDFFLLGRLFLAAIGVFIFLRIFGADFYPSLCGGALYGLSGAMTVFLTLTQMSNVGMMIPYALIGSELLQRRQNIFSLAFCGISIALLILAGQPETAFYALVFVGSYYAVRIFSWRKEALGAMFRKVLGFGGALAIALVISSPFFVPFFLNGAQYFSLHPAGGTQGTSGYTPPENFAAILLPGMLRWRTETYGFTFNYGWDRLGGYTGIAGMFLILAALRRKTRGRRCFLFFLIFGALILFKNAGAPFINWIGRLPFFDQVWTPRWAGPVWNLSFALCAALGLQALLDTDEPPRNPPLPPPFRMITPGVFLLPLAIEVLVLYVGALFNLHDRLWGWLLDLSISSGFTGVQLWNMFFILAWMAGVLFIFLFRGKEKALPEANGVSSGGWRVSAAMITGILVLSGGIIVNALLWSMLTGGQNEIVRRMPLSTKHILQVFCLFMSSLIVVRQARKLRLSLLAVFFCFFVLGCIFNFQAQAQQIAGEPVKSIFAISDKAVSVSVFEGLFEAIIFAVSVICVMHVLWRYRSADKTLFAFIVSAVVIAESMFQVTVGYGEKGRIILFVWYFLALSFVLFRWFSPAKSMAGFRKGMAVFFAGLIGIGAIGIPYMPPRAQIFSHDYYRELALPAQSRIMGLRGALFPNAAAALGIYDVRSIVSLSIERFQLFQDYCLFKKPQEIYKRLWFTGLIDNDGADKGNLEESLKERYYFYALAGVSHYYSYAYEDIPHTRLIQDGNIKSYQSLIAMPRAFVVHAWVPVPSPLRALDWMLQNAFLLNSQAVIEGEVHGSPGGQSGGAVEPLAAQEARIVSYGLHSVFIETETSAPGLLVLTDVYHPDWKATVDGRPAQVFPADLCFRGVLLPPGKHKVAFIFRPVVFYLCSGVSFVTFVVIAALALLGLKRVLARRRMGTGTEEK